MIDDALLAELLRQFEEGNYEDDQCKGEECECREYWEREALDHGSVEPPGSRESESSRWMG